MEPHQDRKSGLRLAPLSLKRLLEGTDIILNPEVQGFSSDEDDDDFFDENSLQSFRGELERICRCDDDDPDLDLSSFEVLSKKMQPVTDDGLVKKVELRPGSGPVIPAKALVVVHYNAYTEKQSAPFDSTYQRNSPFKFLLGSFRVLPWLEIAVATMKKGEVSSFLVGHDYAYGAKGYPPRIPPSATLYYEVELLTFVDREDAIEFEQMTEDEKRSAPFHKIFSGCQAEREMGSDLFQKGMFLGANFRYRRAINILEQVCGADKYEDNERQLLLMKMYMNSAICYIKLENGKRARINAQNVLKFDPNRTKALYTLGKSYVLDGEYDEALRYFYKAQETAPSNKIISGQISLAQEMRKQREEKDALVHKNIFGRRKTDYHFNEPKEFVDAMKELVKNFRESTEREYSFSSGLSPSQIEDIKTVASLNGVQFTEKICDGDRIFKLCK